MIGELFIRVGWRRPHVTLWSCRFVLAILVMAKAYGAGSEWENSVKSYRQAKELARILALGCDVVEGIVSRVDLAPPASAPVVSDLPTEGVVELCDLKWILGSRTIPGGTLRMTRFEAPKRTKTSDGPWQPWVGVIPRVGGRLGIVLWKEGAGPRWLNRPVDVAWVAAEDQDLRVLRSTASLAKGDQAAVKSGEGIWRDPADTWSVLELGYLVGAGLDRIASRDGGNAVDVALAAWSDTTRADLTSDDLGAWMAANAHRLPGDSLLRLGRVLVLHAAGLETKSARIAMETLGRLVDGGTLNLSSGIERGAAATLRSRVPKWLPGPEHESTRKNMLDQIGNNL